MSQFLIDGTELSPPLVFGEGLCGCGCGDSLNGRSGRAKYVDKNHAQKAYRRRVAAEMERVGLPALPSLRAAGISRPTTDHNGDAEIGGKPSLKGKPSGAQVSYFKAVEVLHSQLDIGHAEAQRILRQALSTRQREQLERRAA